MDSSMCNAESHRGNNDDKTQLGSDHRKESIESTDVFTNIEKSTTHSHDEPKYACSEKNDVTQHLQSPSDKISNRSINPEDTVYRPFYLTKSKQVNCFDRVDMSDVGINAINTTPPSYVSKLSNSVFNFETIAQPVVVKSSRFENADYKFDRDMQTTYDRTSELFTHKSTDMPLKVPLPKQNSPLIMPSNSDTKSGQFFTFSSLSTDSYKHGQYFHFPGVDSPFENIDVNQKAPRYCNNNIVRSSASSLSSSINNNYNLKNNNIERDSKCNEYERINDNEAGKQSNSSTHGGCMSMLRNDDDEEDGKSSEAVHNRNGKSEAARRARLKSISLDSDGAKLVEENLYIPVEELVERANSALYADGASSRNQNKIALNQIVQESKATENNSKTENMKMQIIELVDKDEDILLDGVESCKISHRGNDQLISEAQSTQTPKTPTLSHTRQKAISFDSELLISNKSNMRARSNEEDKSPSCYELSQTDNTQNEELSSSVPTTPKMKLRSTPLSSSSTKMNQYSKKVFRNSYPKASSTECHHHYYHHLEGCLNSSENSDECSICGLSNIEYIFSFNNPTQMKVTNYQSSASHGSTNPNLKTLPEVEFKEDYEKYNEEMVEPRETSAPNNAFFSYSDTMQISNQYGTNSCDDIANDDMDGSVFSLVNHRSGGSNYSLSNLQGSHCSLSRSNFNIYSSGGMSGGNNSSKQRFNTSENLNIMVASPCITSSHNKLVPKKQSDSTSIYSANTRYECKKDIIQRRDSNTSLTMNSDRNDANSHKKLSMNRFNSHSSLNTITAPFDMPRISSTNVKKGLLERRNSNTSLTLNIQKRALSTSNCNVRDSNLSLSSTTNNSEKSLDEARICSFCSGTIRENVVACNVDNKHIYRYRSSTSAESKQNATQGSHIEISYKSSGKLGNNIPVPKRKFLSSENLYTKNQTFQIREANEPKQVIDYSIHSSNIDLNKSNRSATNDENCSDFNKKFYCQCGSNTTRNITTKPLSPQATSEDFKIYLANIQLLQNATNVKSFSEIQKLIYVFSKSYVDRRKDENGCTRLSSDKEFRLSEAEQNSLVTNIHKEFWDLPTNFQEKPLVFGSQIKNRYKTILPNEHSRVILQKELIFDQCGGNGQSYSSYEPYINANYIKGPDYTYNSYIATQGPMSNTIYDFWLMVYHNSKQSTTANSISSLRHQKIIMLTDIIENDESKCAIYFPQEVGRALYFINGSIIPPISEKLYLKHLEEFYSVEHNWDVNNDNILFIDGRHFNYFCIKNIAVYNRNGYSIRKLHCLYMTYVENPEKQLLPELKHFIVYHYWFQHWPDHRSPENVNVVLDMCLDVLDSNTDDVIGRKIDYNIDDTRKCQIYEAVNEAKGNDKNDAHSRPELIIHCSAGIGRTGCVTAILNGLQQIRKLIAKDINKISVDILGIVSNLRLQRGGMVQNSEQYELIHRVLCLYLQRVIENTTIRPIESI